MIMFTEDTFDPKLEHTSTLIENCKNGSLRLTQLHTDEHQRRVEEQFEVNYVLLHEAWRVGKKLPTCLLAIL